VKVFVAGATGAIGTPLVRQLLAAGHEVTGMTRRPERAERLREAGAEAVVCDVYDAERLEQVVVAAAPEAVVHLLTDLPSKLDPRADLGPNNRIRTEGTRNLLAAAEAAGARRLVAESVGFFYRLEGEGLKTEEDPLDIEGEAPLGEAVRAVVDLERQVVDAGGLALRFGWIYGPGTYYSVDGSQAAEVRKRRLPIVGDGAGVFSMLHVEDAASAILAALEYGEPDVYNVVDDDPAPMREWLPEFAEALGAKPPLRAPAWLARRVVGRLPIDTILEMRGASNEKAKRELEWQPRYRSWRQGFVKGLG
jgi:nucleoside-diphosphate-sugar epimerase